MNILRLLWICTVLLPTATTLAGDLDVQIFDQEGRPVQDAVITLKPSGAHARTDVRDTVAVMEQRGKTFSPHVLAVHTGTRVEFSNRDPVRHHVYSFSPPKPFELKLYSGSETPSVVFNAAGTVALGYNIHDWMQAYIYVTDDPLFSVSAQDGSVRFPGLVPGEYQVTLWHPRLRREVAETQRVMLSAENASAKYALQLRPGPRPRHPPEADMDPNYGGAF